MKPESTGEASPAQAKPCHPLHTHGGDLAAAAAFFPLAPKPWLDLSTGINPRPYPVGKVDVDGLAHLPTPAALAALQAQAARHYGAASGDCVVAAPGTQAIMQTLPGIFLGKRVAILGHSYGGHAEAWRGRCAAFAQVEDVAGLAGADIAIVVNPNNPDGRTIEASRLRALAAGLAKKAGLLVVDEAFADVAAPSLGLAPSAHSCGALVLRSFGKMFGLAGLRLGFAVASPEFAGVLRARLGSWPVSGLAIELGCRALADEAWCAATRVRLQADARRLDALLVASGLVIVGGTDLFRLARHTHAARLFTHLCAQGILARPFAERPESLRFGLPGDEIGWQRLGAALAGFRP